MSNVYCRSFLQNILKLFARISSDLYKSSSQCVVASGKPIYYLANKKKKKKTIAHLPPVQTATTNHVRGWSSITVFGENTFAQCGMVCQCNGLEFHSYSDCKTFWGTWEVTVEIPPPTSPQQCNVKIHGFKLQACSYGSISYVYLAQPLYGVL